MTAVKQGGGKMCCRYYFYQSEGAVFVLFKFSVIEQRGNQHDKKGACVMHQSAGGRGQKAQHRAGNGDKIDAHRQDDT